MIRRLVPFMCLLILSACKKEEHKAFQMPPPEVTDYVVQQQNLPVIFDFVGFAQSSHPVEIRARVEGYLDKIAYQEGQIVKAGELLFQLDPRLYQADVEKAKAEVARQEAILANANLTVDRLRPLFEKNAASKKDLDNAIASQLSSQASVLAAKAQLLYNEVNLSYTTITSPITGYSDKAKFREGALINPASNSLMTTVSVIDPIWVYFTVSDNDILKTQEQEAKRTLVLPQDSRQAVARDNNQYIVEVTMSDGSLYPIKGIVDYSSPTYDQATGTLQVRAVFQNPEGMLRPGQFVRVKVKGAERPEALTVPRRAIQQNKNGMFVYLIDKDNKVIVQDVTGGDWFGNYQVITNGLKVGDRIVVDGVNKVMPGATVKVTGVWKDPGDSKTKVSAEPAKAVEATKSAETPKDSK